MAAKLYCQITGIILLIVGVLGIVGYEIKGFLSISEPAEIGLHLILGALSTLAGFNGGEYSRIALWYARVFGLVYLALGIAGFAVTGGNLFLGIHLDLGCNIVHLALGVWGIYAGFFAGQEEASPATA